MVKVRNIINGVIYGSILFAVVMLAAATNGLC